MAENAEIIEFLCGEIASILHYSKSDVTADTPFMSLGMHSMVFVELLIGIEKKYGIKLINSGLGIADLTSVSSLAARVASELEKQK